jgi:hypothetical protein
MRAGTIDYIVLEFPDGFMSEEVGVELLWLAITHVIRVLDFVFLTKDDATRVSILRPNELSQMGGLGRPRGARGRFDR